jgi:hypothetical protein
VSLQVATRQTTPDGEASNVEGNTATLRTRWTPPRECALADIIVIYQGQLDSLPPHDRYSRTARWKVVVQTSTPVSGGPISGYRRAWTATS